MPNDVVKTRDVGTPAAGSTTVVVDITGTLGGAEYTLNIDSAKIAEEGFVVELDYRANKPNAPKITSANLFAMLKKFDITVAQEIQDAVDSSITLYYLKIAPKKSEFRLDVKIEFGPTFIVNKLKDILTVDSIALKVDREPTA